MRGLLEATGIKTLKLLKLLGASGGGLETSQSLSQRPLDLKVLKVSKLSKLEASRGLWKRLKTLDLKLLKPFQKASKGLQGLSKLLKPEASRGLWKRLRGLPKPLPEAPGFKSFESF